MADFAASARTEDSQYGKITKDTKTGDQIHTFSLCDLRDLSVL
jgi:hypothetical protein